MNVYPIEKRQNLPQKEAAEYGIEEFPKMVVFENGIPNLYDGGFTDGQVLIPSGALYLTMH